MQELKVPSKEQIAFVEEACQEHHAEVVKYLIGLLRTVGGLSDRRRVAEKLMQNVYMNLLQYNVPAHIRIPIAFLKTSALHEFLKYRRQRKRDQVWLAELDEEVIQGTSDERSTDDENVARLEALRPAIARLSPMAQQIITMMLERKSAREIVDALGVSKADLVNARRMLRKSINDVIHGRVRK